MNFFRSCCLARARISLADLICPCGGEAAGKHGSAAEREHKHTDRHRAATHRGRQIHRHRRPPMHPRRANQQRLRIATCTVRRLPPSLPAILPPSVLPKPPVLSAPNLTCLRVADWTAACARHLAHLGPTRPAHDATSSLLGRRWETQSVPQSSQRKPSSHGSLRCLSSLVRQPLAWPLDSLCIHK